MTRRMISILVVIGFVAGSCGGAASSPTTDVEPTVEAAVATTAVATATPASPQQASTSSTTEVVLDQWELVVFGDSFAAKSGWPTFFADMAASEFDVSISVGGAVCYGGCTALDRIRNSDTLRSQIATAELIVIQPQPGRVVAPLWRSYEAGDCGGDDGLACFRQAEADFRLYVEELFDEVIELSEPGTVIRAMRATGTWALDVFHPGLREAAPAQFDAFLENMLTLSEHIAQAAAARCILALDVNAIMSGPDYREPVSAEYSNDGSHPSEHGSEVIAEALGSLGYQSTVGSCSSSPQ